MWATFVVKVGTCKVTDHGAKTLLQLELVLYKPISYIFKMCSLFRRVFFFSNQLKCCLGVMSSVMLLFYQSSKCWYTETLSDYR